MKTKLKTFGVYAGIFAMISALIPAYGVRAEEEQALEPNTVLVQVDDTDKRIIYTSGATAWGSEIGMGTVAYGAYGGSAHWGDSGNASFAFNGTSVSWIGRTSPQSYLGNGSARVYIDDVLQETVSMHSDEDKVQAVVYSKMGLEPGNHTLKIEPIGDANINIDALQYNSAETEITVDDQIAVESASSPYAGIVYDDNWKFTASEHTAAAVGGSFHESTNAGAVASFTFEGTSVKLLGVEANWLGEAVVYVDDETEGTTISSGTDTGWAYRYRSVLFEKNGLEPGTHTLRIVASSSTNPFAFDAIVYTPGDGQQTPPSEEEEEEGNESAGAILQDDFEEDAAGEIPLDWTVSGQHLTGLVQSSPIDGAANQSLKVDHSDYSPVLNTISRTFEPTTDNLHVRFSYFEDTAARDGSGGMTLRLRDGAANKTALSLANHYGFKYNVGDEEEATFGAAVSLKWDPDNLAGKWRKIEIIANMAAKTFGVKLDGEELGSGLPFLNNVSRIDTIAVGRINFAVGATLFDDIVVEPAEGLPGGEDGGGDVPLPANPAYAINYFYTFNPVPYLLGDNAVPGGGTVGWSIDVSGTDKGGTAPETPLDFKFKVMPAGANPDDYEFVALDTVTEQGVKLSRSTRPWDMSAAFSIQTEALPETRVVDIWAYARDKAGTWENKAPYPLALTIVGRNDSRLTPQADPLLKEIGAVDTNMIALNIQEGTVVITGQQDYDFGIGDYVEVIARDNREIKKADGQFVGKLAVDNNEIYATIGSQPEKRYIAQAGDKIVYAGSDSFELNRLVDEVLTNVGTIRIVNPKAWIPERVEGKAVNRFALDRPDTFRVTSGGEEVEVAHVYRKEKVNNKAVTDNGYTTDHWVFLELSENLSENQTYDIELGNGLYLSGNQANGNVISFTHSSRSNRSEAIHASHIGFKPSDGLKRGFLSIWLGSGNEHAYDEKTFNVIDAVTKESVFTGNIKLIRAFNEVEEMSPNSLPYENTSKTNVYELDFSKLKREGSYLLHIDGIGTSYPFEIRNTVWEDAFRVSVNGLYYNRSGIEIDLNGYKRPRSYHPDEGVQVYQSTVGLVETGNGLNASGHANGNFDLLISTRTEHLLRDDAIWGGYYDAGDWDKRIQHLFTTRQQMELMLMNPGAYDGLDMQLPDSALVYKQYTEEDMQNAGLTDTDIAGIPDLLAESLWNLDFYRRLQVNESDWKPENADWLGGIRGGIEATDHPAWGEASWQDSLMLMVYGPDVWSSYVYAGTAARAAYLLEGLGKDKLAALYRNSALQAYAYTERNLDSQSAEWDDYNTAKIVSEKAFAEVELYRLTKDARYHTAFKQTMNRSGKSENAGKLFDKVNRATWLYDYQTAIFAYITLPQAMTDAQLVKDYKKIIIGYDADPRKSYGSAEHAMAYMDRNTWGASMWDEGVPLLGFLSPFSTPHVDAVIRAHYITGDNKYRDAIVKSTQFSLGANQDNMTMTTGLGYEHPENTLHLESRQTGQANPPGITVYGSFKLDTLFGWPIGSPNFAYPELFDYDTFAESGNKGLSNWPTAESFLDIFLYPAMLEWTVQQTMGPTAYTWGYLSASDNIDKPKPQAGNGGSGGGTIIRNNELIVPDTDVQTQGNGGRVQLNDADLSQVVNEASEGNEHTIIVKINTSSRYNPLTIAFNPASLNSAIASGISAMQVVTGIASVQIALDSLLEQANGQLIELIIEHVGADAIGNAGSTAGLAGDSIYRISLTAGGKPITSLAGQQPLRINIPYKLPSGVNADHIIGYFINSLGDRTPIKRSSYDPVSEILTLYTDKLGLIAVVEASIWFDDMTKSVWAREAVEYLAVRGIVHGVGGDRFAPSDTVTREQFITMLVQAFDLAAAAGPSPFSDVDDSKWYADSVATAASLGIVSGYADGSFGVGKDITRQEMAAMIYRAIEVLAISLPDRTQNISFTDQSQFAAFAEEAIAALGKAGLVSGVGNGSFAPLANATRAQAAQLLYNLLITQIGGK
ncbi:S-layer homology domain-containing protein [Paenibacillus sp. YIM B09110]|uniref:S-layer homology domain-containing protein n=1 Tax=Paenibacillus sp. YIM B09110 TaxID=3126102 RepID=UPI00301E10DF